MIQGTSEHKKGDVGIQAWSSIDFGWISGPHFSSYQPALEQHMCFFVMRVSRSRFLMISAFGSGYLGLQNEAFGMESVGKQQLFTYIGMLLSSVLFFLLF